MLLELAVCYRVVGGGGFWGGKGRGNPGMCGSSRLLLNAKFASLLFAYLDEYVAYLDVG